MNISAYLKRIGLEDCGARNLEFLKKLQFAHILSVPYENIDIINGIPLKLDEESLFKKIVENNRGGYCFEVNALFSMLLRAMGFNVYDYAARFLRNQETLSFRRHRVIAVNLPEGVYILDAGMGQSAPKHPLKLENGLKQTLFGETYKFKKQENGEWILYDWYQGDWREFYSFFSDSWLDVDFIPASFYCEKNENSVFNKTLMVAIKTPSGRKAINGRDFKIFEGENIKYIEENCSDERLSQILKTEFKINID